MTTVKNYLHEHSSREIFGNTLEIYWDHIGLLFLLHFLPTFPFTFWDGYINRSQDTWFNIASYLALVIEILPAMAITVAVSDICLGNQPVALRAYRRVLNRNFGKLIASYLLLVVGQCLSLVLFIVPGILFAMWFMFVLIVMVLERSYGRLAFARSKTLGAGFYKRNLGIILAIFFSILTAFFLQLLAVELIVARIPESADPVVYSILSATGTSLVNPILYVSIVLLYYDMRVRKEAYDNTALTEDLMR